MIIRPIKSEAEYRAALARLDELFDAQKGDNSDEADVIALLVDDYEKHHYPIEAPDPIEAIRIRMEELQLKQSDLIEEFGGKNRASEIMNKKRKLTIEMIRNLSKRLHLPAALLINDYELPGS